MTPPSLAAQLAELKKLPLKFLNSLGVRDCPSGVSISYGTMARGRIRCGLSAKDGFRWIGTGKIMPYEIWRLGKII